MDEYSRWCNINEAQHLDYFPFICSNQHPYVFFSSRYYEECIFEFTEQYNINVEFISSEDCKLKYNIKIKEYPNTDVCLILLKEIPKDEAYKNTNTKLLHVNHDNNLSIQHLYNHINENTNGNVWYPELNNLSNKLKLTFESYLIDLSRDEMDYLINISPVKSILIDNKKDININIRNNILGKIQRGIDYLLDYNSNESNYVFVRLYSVSPKNQSSCCNNLMASNPIDVLSLITSSSRAISSLEECNTNGIMLREYIQDLPTDYEFRLFIHGKCLRAISQYKCYSIIPEFQNKTVRETIYSSICSWWKSVYKIVPYDDCTVDIIFLNNLLPDTNKWNVDTIKIIEINSFGAGSLCGSSLYSWIVDFDIMYYSKPPAIRFVDERLVSYPI